MARYYDWPSGDSYRPDDLIIADTDHASIANFLETSADVQKLGGHILVSNAAKAETRLPDGWSITAQILEAVPEYAGQAGKGYSFSVQAAALPEWAPQATLTRGFEKGYLEDLWGVMKQEIDAKRPLVASIDATSDGIAEPNHSVPVVGYWEKPDGNYYGFYDNWGEPETIRWEKYAAPAADVEWGVAALYTITREPASPIAFDPGLFDLALIA